MDRVRLGRVLGRGARLAARTAYEALDAATSPDPVSRQVPRVPAPANARPPSAPELLRPARATGNANTRLPGTGQGTVPGLAPTAAQGTTPTPGAIRGAQEAVRKASQTRQRLAQATRGFSSLEPVKRASRAVSLQVSGSFFALFAFSFALGAWRLRADVHVGTGLYRLAICCSAAAVFFWFSISNFAKARRLERHRA